MTNSERMTYGYVLLLVAGIVTALIVSCFSLGTVAFGTVIALYNEFFGRVTPPLISLVVGWRLMDSVSQMPFFTKKGKLFVFFILS